MKIRVDRENDALCAGHIPELESSEITVSHDCP